MRLQRTGACGPIDEWLVSATEVVQVLCCWRGSRPPKSEDNMGQSRYTRWRDPLRGTRCNAGL